MYWYEIKSHDSNTPKENEAITIPEGGYYFVFTQVHIIAKGGTAVDDNPTTIHVVEKKSQHDHFEEVANSTFQCTLTNKELQHTSSLKKIIKAEKDDELRVVVKYSTEELDTDKLQNYFGIFKL